MPTISDLPPPAQPDPPMCCDGVWMHTATCDVAPLDQIEGDA